MTLKKRNWNQGVILPFVLVLLISIAALAFALHLSGLTNLFHVFRSKQAFAAYFAAQAGLARTLHAVQANEPFLPVGCGVVSAPANLSNQVLSNAARFTVTVTSNHLQAEPECASNAAAPDGTLIPPGFVYFSSVGKMGGVTRTAHEMVAMHNRFPPFFVLTDQGIDIQGSGYSDSYDSSNPALQTLLSYQRQGNLGTNSSQDGAVTLGLGTLVHGNIWVGPDGTDGPPTVSAQSPITSYAISIFKNKWIMIPPSDPLGGPGTVMVYLPLGPQLLTPGKYADVEVGTGGVLTLSCGVYSLRSLILHPQSQLVIPATCNSSSPVILYVYRKLNLAGGDVTNSNVNQEAASFLIYGMKTLLSANVPAGPRAVLSLYAPFAHIEAGPNSEIFGALIGRSFTARGAGFKFHFDEALPRSNQAVVPLAVVKSWKSE